MGARDLRECLLAQLHDLKRIDRKNGNGNHVAELEALDDAIVLVDQHLHALQNKHYKEVAKAMGRPLEAVMSAMDFIRTLDPAAWTALQQGGDAADRARRGLHQAGRRIPRPDE